MKTRRIRVWAAALAVALAVGGAQKALSSVETDSVQLKPGFRAVTLPILKHQLINLKPGERVDLMVTFDAILAKGEKEKITATILQNVLVLTVNLAETTVGLMVNPNEAQYAALATDKGELWLLVRTPGDTEVKPMEMASFRKLFR